MVVLTFKSAVVSRAGRRLPGRQWWVMIFFVLLQGTLPAQEFSSLPNFQSPVYQELPLGAIKPRGWLLQQLTIMRKGTTGNLDGWLKKISDNGWRGGNGDAWEATPYWLDGAVPLAWLLNDTAFKIRMMQYINWTLDHQRPSGYFGPITKQERESGKSITAADCNNGEDWWPKMVMLKVLQQYYSATEDKRVLLFMTKYFQYQYQALQQCPLNKWTEWAEARGMDNILIVQWLYQKTKQPQLLQLAAALQKQTLPWSKFFAGRDWTINAAAYQNDQHWMARHGVNVAMGLKDPAVHYQRTGDKKYLSALHTGFKDLMTLHGLPFGCFSADEDLHGNNPSQGTELCAIVESMFSLEQITGITGDVRYMDALERITFNALPAQTTVDFNNKQYFQIANQVHIKKGVFTFTLPFDREMNNVLGMRSGYTCCLENMHQGWTKFTTHLWYGTKDGGLAALHYAPSEVNVKPGKSKTAVTIKETTNYPFENIIRFDLTTNTPVSFPFQLRIPAWCRLANIYVNGVKLRTEKGGQIITVSRTWKNGDQLKLELPMEVSVSQWGSNSRAIERGPLLYALKLKEEWEKGTDEHQGDYFTVHTNDKWNYGLVAEQLKQDPASWKVNEVQQIKDDFVWDLQHAPIEIKVQAKKIPGWTIANDIALIPVTARDGLYMGRVENETETITLVPYGCTKVRIVAFPVVK
ncbi:beta-L-arabinofuranosidase (glycosyl hydrolase family 127) [Pseudobacter ginsenosidimutans]|uniref:Beta-L-arabinofuranosidase (Glycosyl hydrolase family 127) n=2 Tax=Pseudobacter ginsenosidimutans TaxID=661488 RepID=A0A4Q7MZ94_9BACT|nr:beta-L-arabinofuranosidase (glycosyl hydrolase family 127) [Pseudobacter ginsenosidimutans]